MTAPWSTPPDLAGYVVAYAPCISCGNVFGFDPETVPSSSVHPETRCTIRPDGTAVRPGDRDAVREPLCPTCAAWFASHRGHDRPLLDLFPHARVDLIDLDAAHRHRTGDPS